MPPGGRPVEVGRFLQGRGCALGDQPHEPIDIDLGTGPIESDASGVDHDQGRRVAASAVTPADRERRLS